jgi:hypothetical protein
MAPATYATFYAYPNPIYQPAMRLVSAITNAFPAQVTTTFAHLYQSGTIVRMYVPFPTVFGMPQINQQVGEITVTGATTFTINIDTTNYFPFTYNATPPVFINQAPMVVPIGEDNAILNAAVVNTLNSNPNFI